MSNIDTNTLVEANQLLSASIHAIDAYLAGLARTTDADVQQMSDLSCHALLLVNMISKHSGRSVEQLSETPVAKFTEIIHGLMGVARR